MLQRIQSIFLLAAAACSGATWFFPVRTLVVDGSTVRLFTYGIEYDNGVEVDGIGLPLPYYILHSVVAAALIVSVFLYGKRARQIRVVRGTWIMGMLITVLQYMTCNSMGAYFAYGAPAEGSYGISFFLPMATILFAILAERAIKKDEDLVKSADRLR